jgi:hypothetical protein
MLVFTRHPSGGSWVPDDSVARNGLRVFPTDDDTTSGTDRNAIVVVDRWNRAVRAMHGVGIYSLLYHLSGVGI